MAEQPSGELERNGPNVERCVREALEALGKKPGHDPETGQFIRANTEARTTLQRSEQFWSAVGQAKQELLEQVRRDAGLNGDAAETLRGLQEAYCEARLFRQAMFVRLVELGGPITTKGKARALFTAYLAALDREAKLAQTLGLERRARKVPTLEEWARDLEARKQAATAEDATTSATTQGEHE